MELEINNENDREKVVVALANAGYSVRVEKRQTGQSSFYGYNYFIVIDEKKET
jgi:hypothetical protein